MVWLELFLKNIELIRSYNLNFSESGSFDANITANNSTTEQQQNSLKVHQNTPCK